ncbi:MAG: hypothetical protein Tsb009_03250 [Planctomycetaceae bacterium]
MATVIQTPSAMENVTEQTPDDPDVFTNEEREMFEEDDQTAGRIIGKMMSTLFFYSFLIMLVVIFWTFRVVF